METVNRELVQAWLNLQCSMVAGVRRAAVLMGSRPAAVGEGFAALREI